MHHGKIFRCAQPTSGLGNPVDGLGNNANHRLAVRTDDVGARWLPAVDDLAVYEFALKIGSHEVNAANIATIACGVSK